MKKLMIAAAIVCAAAFAQAGAVKWSATTIDASPAGAYKDGTTYLAYFFEGSDVAGVTKYLSGETMDLDAFVKASADKNTATYNTEREVLTFNAKSYGAYEQGDIATGFMIIFDAADIKDAKNYQIAEKNGDQVLSTSAFGKSGDKSLSWASQEGVAWQSIPEPTSGLLLLLGVAGLALRRRRA